MLSVITVLAIAFLAVSRRERVAVTQKAESTEAQLAADAALERAKAMIVGSVWFQALQINNNYPANFVPPGLDLTVSRSYVNPLGYNPNWPGLGEFNVSYTNSNGTPLYSTDASKRLQFDPNEYPRMLTNMLLDPRPPVIIDTNPPNATVAQRGPPDFRFFLDLDRNGTNNLNGFFPVVDDNGNRIPDGAGGFLTNWFVGDPEWIGILQDPFSFHSRNNRFIGRYAFIILPAGRALDLNFIHNQVKFVLPGMSGFHRHQGFGAWEINLAAFLADLNVNAWAVPIGATLGYRYEPDPMSPNRGRAFGDAFELFRLRYGGMPYTVPSALIVFGGSPGWFPTILNADFIDSFGDSGDPLLGASMAGDDDNVNRGWPGAHSTRHYHDLQDYFAPGKSNLFPQFHQRLNIASRLPSSYDSSTYYRMLAQLGTDSVSEEPRPLVRATYSTNVMVNGSTVFIRVAQHGFYSGDWVRVLNNGKQPLSTNRITVLDANTFAYVGFPPPNPPPRAANYVADPFAHTKINLNYDNLNEDRHAPHFPSATNFLAWTPESFFRATAERLLREELGVGLERIPGGPGGIPVFTNGSSRILDPNYPAYLQGELIYRPRLHQLLQITANIYDATIASKNESLRSLGLLASAPLEDVPYYPTVYRPLFSVEDSPLGPATAVYITNYVEVGSEAQSMVQNNIWGWYDLNNPLDRVAASGVGTNANFYGIPFIIAARAGFPNFNKFAVQTTALMTRRLQFLKRDTNSPPYLTNQLITMAISNTLACQTWNSYTSTYPRMSNSVVRRDLQLVFRGDSSATLLANGVGFVPVVANPSYVPTNIPASTWRGLEFKVPILTNQAIVQYQALRGNSFVSADARLFEPLSSTATNQWRVAVTNRLRYFLFDNGRLVDCVTLSDLNTEIDISTRLLESPDLCWDNTPNPDSVTDGIGQQIMVSAGFADPGGGWESSDPRRDTGQPRESAMEGFRRYMFPQGDDKSHLLIQHAPYTPSWIMTKSASWEASDPLVHYTTRDLSSSQPKEQGKFFGGPNQIDPLTTEYVFDDINTEFNPWGGREGNVSSQRVGLKDPFPLGVYRRRGMASDYWEFPTNKFPSIGWLGRVHRGTPWQTIYLKADVVSGPDWLGGPGKSVDTLPTKDWRLVDFFTVAQHPNATRGQLSINQTNLAAWSAVLSGVTVTRALDLGSRTYRVGATNIQPAAYETNVSFIVNGINQTRTNAGGPQQFARLSDILSVPQLTTASPFLFETPDAALDATSERNVLTDSDYERIPERILSLLKLGEPRFVIYAYGQSLKPAPNSIVQSGPAFGLCQNYQITGEVAYRAVVRVEPGLDEAGAPIWDVNHRDSRDNPDFRAPRTVIESFNVLPPE